MKYEDLPDGAVFRFADNKITRNRTIHALLKKANFSIALAGGTILQGALVVEKDFPSFLDDSKSVAMKYCVGREVEVCDEP